MSPASSTPDRSLALIGLMGAGKSSIGQRLARRLGLAFTDSDAEIERAAGMSISDIFDAYGETEFRALERRVIARLAAGRGQVIATGGGAFMDPETRALLLERCTVVWLDADMETLVERVSRSNKRPLLVGKDPRQVLSELAALRYPVYAEAHLRVRSEAVPAEKMVEKIVSLLQALPG